jgi:hypothetical protein
LRVLSGTASRGAPNHLSVLRVWQALFLRHGFAPCGLPLLGSALETLREVIGLPEALGAHPCECGHPEMRRLPDGVFHCPACRSEFLPIRAQAIDAPREGGRWSAT